MSDTLPRNFQAGNPGDAGSLVTKNSAMEKTR